MKKVLTISGSDSSGCSGIQRDIRTITALDSHPFCAVSAITTQTTSKVLDVSEIYPDLVRLQIRTGLASGAEAVKIGVLPSTALVAIVAEELSGTQLPIVIDPVIQSSSGHIFSDSATLSALKNLLFPLATILTPNLKEASEISGALSEQKSFLEIAGQSLLDLGPQSVLITGGHSPDLTNCTDFFFDRRGLTTISGPRVPTSYNRGTGCTLSSAIATFLARGETALHACRKAKVFVQSCLERGYPVDSEGGTLNSGYHQDEG
jgi:hydroxymethylpyrimidine/phosphomethylpyrimidine kinase